MAQFKLKRNPYLYINRDWVYNQACTLSFVRSVCSCSVSWRPFLILNSKHSSANSLADEVALEGRYLILYRPKTLDPRSGLVSDSKVMEHVRKALMGNFTKRIAKIQQDGVFLLMSFESSRQIMYSG